MRPAIWSAKGASSVFWYWRKRAMPCELVAGRNPPRNCPVQPRMFTGMSCRNNAASAREVICTDSAKMSRSTSRIGISRRTSSLPDAGLRPRTSSRSDFKWMLESGWRMQAVGMALRCEVRVHVRRLGAARAEHFLLAPSEEGFDAAQKRGAGAQNAASHDRDFARCNQGGPRNGRTGGHRCDFEALDGFPEPPGGEGADGADGRAGCEHRSPSSEGSSDGNDARSRLGH